MVQQCLLCGSPQSSLFDQRVFRNQQVSNRLCSSCGLVYQSPRMSDQELSEFYDQEYRQLYQGNAEPAAKDLAIQGRRADTLLEFVQDQVKTVSRHLDIGCSAGTLLQRFQNSFGCQPTGIEPGSAYRSYAQRQGLEVYASLEELKASGHPVFDLISMAHVLEHLPHPVEYLIDLRQSLLTPRGKLLVEVPNLYGHDCFEIAHLVSFSPQTLTQTLKKAGFEVLTIQEHGQPRSRIIPLYITLLAQPVTASVEIEVPTNYQPIPERGVRRKRQWGLLRRGISTRLFPRRAWLPIPKT